MDEPKRNKIQLMTTSKVWTKIKIQKLINSRNLNSWEYVEMLAIKGLGVVQNEDKGE